MKPRTTNRVRHILIRRDGTDLERDGGVVASDSELPIPGQPGEVDLIQSRVLVVAKTPPAKFTWTVLFLEHELRPSTERDPV
jgi:hypothetical protein